MGDTADTIGPVDFAIVEFPGARVTGEPLAELLTLVDNGVIRILDLVFIAKSADGAIRLVEIADLDGDGALDLQILSGASSGLIDREDQVEAGSALEPGSAAAVLVLENLWAIPFVSSMRRSGAELVASGRIPADALLRAVEAADAAEQGGI